MLKDGCVPFEKNAYLFWPEHHWIMDHSCAPLRKRELLSVIRFLKFFPHIVIIRFASDSSTLQH